ncbi:MAG TPA: 50S ribosomal protein L10 [Clostridia bacterium]|jgi:large subunit ribosomal protein L10|nr:50S ribosomal protein L10 [Clostridia bacterium]
MSQAIREKKEAKVEEIKNIIKGSKSFVLVDYIGINVAQDTELRNAYREANVNYNVFKNTLLKIALNDLGYTQFDEYLVGSTSVAVSVDNEITPAKITAEKIGKFKKMKIKCGMVEGEFFNAEKVIALSKVPSKETLLSQLLGMLLSPISSFARVIDAIAKEKAN